MIAAPWSANRVAASSSRRNRASCQSRRSNTASRAAATRAYASRSRACFRRLYQVEREIPSARHGRAALRLGMIPCALRQRSERRRAFSRRSSCRHVASLHWIRFRLIYPEELPRISSVYCSLLDFIGGLARNRTGMEGFAVLCVTIPPRGLCRNEPRGSPPIQRIGFYRKTCFLGTGSGWRGQGGD